MNAPLDRSKFGKEYADNYDRIFGLEQDMNNQTLVKVEEAIRLNSFSLAKFVVESFDRNSVGSAVVHCSQAVDKETGESYVVLSWSRDEEDGR